MLEIDAKSHSHQLLFPVKKFRAKFTYNLSNLKSKTDQPTAAKNTNTGKKNSLESRD